MLTKFMITDKADNMARNVLNKRILTAIFFGLLFFAGTFLTVRFDFETIKIDFIWSLVFPLLISIAWGKKYGLVSIFFSLSILYPFILRPFNGYANIGTCLRLVLLVVMHGWAAEKREASPGFYFNIYFVQAVHSAISVVLIASAYPLLYSLNPPFWFGGALTSVSSEELIVSAGKSIINEFIIVAIADVLLWLPFIRRILNLEMKGSLKLNTRLLSAFIFLGCLFWFIGVMAGSLFIEKKNFGAFLFSIDSLDLLSLVLIMAFCLIVGGIAMRFFTRYLDSMKLLKKSEIKYKNIFENFKDIYSEVSLDGQVRVISPSVEPILGYTVQEMMAKNFREFYFDPDDREKIINLLLREGEITNYKVSMKDKEGNILNFWNNAKIVLDENGEKQIISVMRDVTKYLEANRKQHESEQKYKLIFEKMINGFFILEAIYDNNGVLLDMVYLDANPGYEKQTQYRVKDIIGRTWSERTQLEKEQFLKMLELYDRILKTGEPAQYDIYSTGEDEYYLVNVFKIKDMQIGVIFQNITAQKKALIEIQMLNKGLEDRVMERTNDLKRAVNELEAFAYTVSHDLKSPLRVIDGYSRIIMEDYSQTLDREVLDMVHNIKSTSTDLIQLINRLLEYSITTKFSINPEEINIWELFTMVFDELKAAWPERDIELEVETELPAVLGDRILIKHVIYDILSNAFKFTKIKDRALIIIGCKDINSEYIFYVRDNGVGFDMEYSGKLYGIFQRLHTKEEFEGSGIGLATVKNIIQKHGGRTWIEGRVGEGAVIYFSIPKSNV